MRIAFNEVSKNKTKSVLLILVFAALILAIGLAFGFVYGNIYSGLFMAGIFAVGYSSFGFFSGDKMILRLSGARLVTKQEYPHLFHTIEGLSIAAGIPVPKAYVIDDTALNAFATGRDPKNASITVTTGLLNKLNRQELEGVVSHEMSHIKHYDIRFMMLVAVLLGIVTLLGDFLLRSFLWSGHGQHQKGDRGNDKLKIIFIVIGLALAILAPIIGQMIKLAISRKREYMADAGGAIMTRYPDGLANALRKIAADPDPLVDKANKATAHLFISTPFRKQHSVSASLFSTHPPIEERIRRLEEM